MKIVEEYAQRKVEEATMEIQKELQAKDEELVAKDEELVAKDEELVAKDAELVAKDDELKKSKQNFVLNLDNEGFSFKDISRIADVSLEFVTETLSK